MIQDRRGPYRSVGWGLQAVDGSGGVVADIQAAIGSGYRVDGAAPAASVGVLKAGDEGDRLAPTVKGTVVVAPTTGVLVDVEVEGAVAGAADVEGDDDVVVVVGSCVLVRRAGATRRHDRQGSQSHSCRGPTFHDRAHSSRLPGGGGGHPRCMGPLRKSTTPGRHEPEQHAPAGFVHRQQPEAKARCRRSGFLLPPARGDRLHLQSEACGRVTKDSFPGSWYTACSAGCMKVAVATGSPVPRLRA